MIGVVFNVPGNIYPEYGCVQLHMISRNLHCAIYMYGIMDSCLEFAGEFNCYWMVFAGCIMW